MARVKTHRGLIEQDCLERIRQAITKTVNQTSASVIRISTDLPLLDPLSVMNQAAVGEALYWSRRGEQRETVGLGILHEIQGTGPVEASKLFDQMTTLLKDADPTIRFYGGFNFLVGVPAMRPSLWQGLPQYRFVLPRFEIVRTVEGCRLHVNLIREESSAERERTLEQLALLRWPDEMNTDDLPSLQERIDRPDYEQWRAMIEKVLHEIKVNKVQKVVLAREAEMRFNGPLAMNVLLGRLRAISKDCFGFGLQFRSGEAWIGATPERIFYRNGRSLQVEAVAGTRPRGSDSRQDEQFASSLLVDGKERREHELVADHIRTVLRRFCGSVVNDNPSGGPGPVVIKQARVQHLSSRFSGELNEGVSDGELLCALHPTPAVGGTPRDEAVAMIQALEPFDRGWYAGPIGTVGSRAAEFAVAIRSGLLCGSRLRLYSGAGIVEGSVPESEWDEIENKLSSFKSALGEL
ncbi:MAG TPA: isochorismate synthase [candidate division Zixibacteria bacterium]|nr:isochorismate synthase [candidate division Zixibacteria bacterium]